jgi:hypothetical protein
MREKYTALVFLILAFGCDMSLDMTGSNFCSPAPDFECVSGFTCRWVSGEPLCLENGATNPDPLLYEENFDDGVADGFIFQSAYGGTSDLSSGVLTLTAPSDETGNSSIEGWIEGKEWKVIFAQVKFKINFFEMPSGGGQMVIQLYNQDPTQVQACMFAYDDQRLHILYAGEGSSNRACVGIPLIENEWYTLQLEAQNNRIVCRLIEAEVQLEFDVSRVRINMTQAGTFGFRVSEHASFSFDDLTVYSERPSTWPNFSAICDS